MFDSRSFSSTSFNDKSWIGLVGVIDWDSIIFGGFGGGISLPNIGNIQRLTVTANTVDDQLISLEDDEVIEFILTFINWHKQRKQKGS